MASSAGEREMIHVRVLIEGLLLLVVFTAAFMGTSMLVPSIIVLPLTLGHLMGVIIGIIIWILLFASMYISRYKELKYRGFISFV